MNKWITPGLMALLPFLSFGQEETYWQNEVAYQIEVSLNTEDHQMKGREKLAYINRSPDTLKKAYFHLYFNAFQPNSMMDVRQRNLPDPDKRIGERIQKLDQDEQGFHKVLGVQMNGQRTNYEVQQTILTVLLPEAIAPGDTAQFELQFESQVPLQIRRSGRDNKEGIDYTMTQWYPKIAEYDEKGWHPNPYVAREFYAPYGSFDVAITLDADQRLAGTGELQDFDRYWKAEEKNEDGTTVYGYRESEKEQRTWRFKADKVHDFAWAADEEYEQLTIEGPDGITLRHFYLDDYDKTWEKLPSYTAEFFTRMQSHFGKYPYSEFSVIQGGDGGMEYPMCTMLKGTGKLDGLIGVMAHESAHSWFYGVLGTNEQQYPWMDEGFTSFAEDAVLNEMGEKPKVNPHGRAYKINAYFFAENDLEPMTTTADLYEKNARYSVNAYLRGQLFLAQLQYILGEEVFQEGMLNYYQAWQFKHPDPWDFLRVMEETSGLHLDWYLNYWINTNKYVDFGIAGLKAKKGAVQLNLERLGTMHMPLRLKVYTKDDRVLEYYVPTFSMMGAPATGEKVLAAWPWTHPSYEALLPLAFEDIDRIIIDEEGFSGDLNPANNLYPREEGQTP